MSDNTPTLDLQGEDSITLALMSLLESCPLITDVSFASLSDTGIAVYPMSSPVVQRETRSIIGHITQRCSYDLGLVCREYGQDEERKISAKDLLDDVGKWLEMQPITVDGSVYVLTEYPTLTGQRQIKRVERTSSASIESIGEDGGALWSIGIRTTYLNEFDTTQED